MATSALLGKGAGKLVGNIAEKVLVPVLKDAVSCTMTGVIKGAVSGGAGGALQGAFSEGVTSYYNHFGEKDDWKIALQDAERGAISGAFWGSVAGGIKGGIEAKYCFVAGTMVVTAVGGVAIEDIVAGDLVLSCDPETGDVTYKRVLKTYINETDTLVHVTTDDDTIVSTSTHPFYVSDKGWVKAGNLKPGDKLVDKNGEIVLVNSVEIEELESPVKVYNFSVEDYHTYYVGSGLLVHNMCPPEEVPDGNSEGGRGSNNYYKKI